jgi:hypothetical protein
MGSTLTTVGTVPATTNGCYPTTTTTNDVTPTYYTGPASGSSGSSDNACASGNCAGWPTIVWTIIFIVVIIVVLILMYFWVKRDVCNMSIPCKPNSLAYNRGCRSNVRLTNQDIELASRAKV